MSVFQSPLWQRRTRRPKKDWHLCKARPLGAPSWIGLREPSFRAVLLKWRSVRHDQMSGLVWMASCTLAHEHRDFFLKCFAGTLRPTNHMATVPQTMGWGGKRVTFYVRELSFSVSVVMCHSGLTSLFEPASRKKVNTQCQVPHIAHSRALLAICSNNRGFIEVNGRAEICQTRRQNLVTIL